MYFYFVSLRATIRIQVQYLTRIRISPYKDADSDRTGSAKLVKAFLYWLFVLLYKCFYFVTVSPSLRNCFIYCIFLGLWKRFSC